MSARFRDFSVFTLAATLAVILWGAYVRATGSGAGCGSHWPTCNGQIIPRPESTATVIEFVHRASSGIAFLLVAAQLVWSLRVFPRGHGARRASCAAMALMVSEALIGAGLVVFEMVADDKSVARATWMVAHLLNTFALVAALTLTVRGAGPHQAPEPGPRGAVLVGQGAVALVAASGALAALGDTLFPATSLSEGIAQDLSSAAHFLVRLRLSHPVLAVVVGTGLLVVTGRIVLGRSGPRALATAAAALVLVQLGSGLLNLALLAPIPLQIVHLLFADLLWIVLVLLAAAMRPATTR